MLPPDDTSVHEATCYLLIGASEGKLQLRARLNEGKIAALEIEPQGDFGGFIWNALAASLVGVPLQAAPLRAKIQAFENSGLIPQEISLAPLVSTLLKIGK